MVFGGFGTSKLIQNLLKSERLGKKQLDVEKPRKTFVPCFSKVFTCKFYQNLKSFSQNTVAKIVPNSCCCFLSLLEYFFTLLDWFCGHFGSLLSPRGRFLKTKSRFWLSKSICHLQNRILCYKMVLFRVLGAAWSPALECSPYILEMVASAKVRKHYATRK